MLTAYWLMTDWCQAEIALLENLNVVSVVYAELKCKYYLQPLAAPIKPPFNKVRIKPQTSSHIW